MKRLTRILSYWPALLVVFSVEFCYAEPAFLASAGNSLTLPGAGEQLTVPTVSDFWDADNHRDQKQSGSKKQTNRSAENNGILSSEAPDSQSETADQTGNYQRIMEDSNLPFKRYLLIVIPVGIIGLGLLAAGLAQWWQRRSLRQKWLFPVAMQDDSQPSALPASSPAPLISKKQMEALHEKGAKKQDKDIKKPAQSRAA